MNGMFDINGVKLLMIFGVAYGINSCFSIKEEYLHFVHIRKSDKSTRHPIRFFKKLSVILIGITLLIILITKWSIL